MSTHTGLEGSVKIGTDVVAEVTSWNLEVSGDTIDATSINSAQGNDGWRSYHSGLKSWTGSLECHWDPENAAGQGALTVGAEVTVNLYPEGDASGDTYFTGSAIVTGITRQASLDGMVEASFEFQGNGPLSTETMV